MEPIEPTVPGTVLDRAATRAGVILPATIGVMTPYMAPVMVGGLIASRGWTAKQAGLLISWEINALAWAALAGALWLHRADRRLASVCGSLALLIGNLGSLMVDGGSAFYALRLLSGIGSGTLMALAYGSLAQTADPHRNYGLFSMAQMVLATLCLAILPALVNGTGDSHGVLATLLHAVGVTHALGINAYFGMMSILGAGAVLISLLVLPGGRGRAVPLSGAPKPPLRTLWPVAVLLFAVFALMVSQNSIWTYVERMGVAAGLSSGVVGSVLALGALAGFVGAGTVAGLGARVPRPVMIVTCLLLQCGALALLATPFGIVGFTVALLLHKYSWNFMVPYQLGMMAEFERSGHAAVLSTFVTSLGISAGSGLAALVVDGSGFGAVLALSLGFALVYAVLMLVVHRYQRKRPPNGAAQELGDTSSGGEQLVH